MEDKEYDRCLRCGRKLKNEEYRRIGYGKICYNKMKPRRSGLFEVERRFSHNDSEERKDS